MAGNAANAVDVSDCTLLPNATTSVAFKPAALPLRSCTCPGINAAITLVLKDANEVDVSHCTLLPKTTTSALLKPAAFVPSANICDDVNAVTAVVPRYVIADDVNPP